jgi:hypothetical protein
MPASNHKRHMALHLSELPEEILLGALLIKCGATQGARDHRDMTVLVGIGKGNSVNIDFWQDDIDCLNEVLDGPRLAHDEVTRGKTNAG